MARNSKGKEEKFIQTMLFNNKIQDTPFLVIENVSKNFGSVQALKNMSLRAFPGKVVGIMGENGAGKSTLMNILSGVYKKTSGKYYINGNLFEPQNIKDSEHEGIAIVHQELLTLNDMTILDNVYLGMEIKTALGFINYKLQRKNFKRVANLLGINIDASKLMSEISIGEQQMVEIAKAILKNAKLIIFDEPTSSLSKKETQNLFKVIKKLQNDQISILYISHRMEEIQEICDYITIIRDGEFIGEHLINEISEDEIIHKMVGREISEKYPKKIESTSNNVKFKVSNLYNEFLKNINFEVKTKEILGFAGLVGSKRTELFRTIIGDYPIRRGLIEYKSQSISKIKGPSDAIKKGIFYVTENRKEEGLFLESSIRTNITISSLNLFKNKFFRFINSKKELNKVDFLFRTIGIKAPNYNYRINQLSGGNQQKVLIAKSFCMNPELIIFDEPTRGVDVGARREIYDLIVQLKQETDSSIIVISSDMQEIIGLCDRVYVMKNGEITKELKKDNLNSEQIIVNAL